MGSPPRPDPAAGLLALAAGEWAAGVWVDPIYRRRGYVEAPTEVWLREEVVERLVAIAAGLHGRGLALLVWDGWRSLRLQQRLWVDYRRELAEQTGRAGPELDERAREFVSPPAADGRVPAHQTGGAVDLTLCSLRGEQLDLGGDFDELTDRSHPDFYERAGLTPSEQGFRDRRRLLGEALTEAGFRRLPSEWWHFEFGTPLWAEVNGESPLFGPIAAA